MPIKINRTAFFCGLFLILTIAGQAQKTPAWWQITLHLDTKSDYRLESAGRSTTGHYSFAIRWPGFMECDDDVYLVYALDTDLREWNASETTFAADVSSPTSTTNFRDKPSFVFNYMLRKSNELHLDFFVNGIVVPQTESEDSFFLLAPKTTSVTSKSDTTIMWLKVQTGSS